MMLVGASAFLEGLARFVSIDFAGQGGHGDAAVDFRAASLFWRDISPYEPEGLRLIGLLRVGFGHPPTTPFWFLPLADLPYVTMAQIVAWLGLAMTLAQIAIGVVVLRFPLPFATTLLAFGLVTASEPVLEHARVVQLSAWIAFAYALAWCWLRQRRDFSAGLVLGCACSLKLFPGLVVLYLVWTGRWRAALGAAASFSVISCVMTSRWGFHAWLAFFQQQGDIAERWLGHIRNASLHGIVRRSLSPLCGQATISESALKWTTTLAGLCVLGAAIWLLSRARRRKPDVATFDFSFALVCALSAFLNPWVWEHYSVILFLPVLIATRALVEGTRGDWQRWQLGALTFGGVIRRVTILAGGSAFLLAFVGSQTHEYLSTTRTWTTYCSGVGSAEVRSWLLRQMQYLVAATWAPWLLVLLVLGLLLALQHPTHSLTEETPRPH
jgi:alpha-1,2-mannosyltransferase